jgi:peptidyl-prolyl cis-trans isomerase B (cyclophilin B)
MTDAPPVLEFPEDSRPGESHTFATFVTPDHWGRGETWAPVTPDVSAEFDDNELLFQLFREKAGLLPEDETAAVGIAAVTNPRSVARIEKLRARLEAAYERNPTLPGWKYHLARLYDAANLRAKAGTIIESIPPHLARLSAFVVLAADHYFGSGDWLRAFKVCDANQRAGGLVDRVKAILDARRSADAEKRAIARDAKKEEPNPRVRLTVAGKGDIVVELFEDDAPHAVLNFMDLVMNRKFFDGLRFDDVVGGSHVGIGDPRTREGAASGESGPPWQLKPDAPKRPFLRGYLAAVPAGAEGALHGSRFVVSVVPLPPAPHGAVFGRVVEGLDVLDNLEAGDRLDRIEIVRKRNHTYDPSPARTQ